MFKAITAQLLCHQYFEGQSMLYKFKSKVAGDVIMLEANGRRVLEIIGKSAGPKGIIEPSQMPAAIAALQTAVTEEETQRRQDADKARLKGELAPPLDALGLRQRVHPFIAMLQICAKANKEVVWGV